MLKLPKFIIIIELLLLLLKYNSYVATIAYSLSPLKYRKNEVMNRFVMSSQTPMTQRIMNALNTKVIIIIIIVIIIIIIIIIVIVINFFFRIIFFHKL